MFIDRIQYISQAAPHQTHICAIEKVLHAGGKWIQLRVKDQAEARIMELAVAAKKLCDSYGARLIINDYPAVALECGAYGVHLGLDDMPVSAARAIVGDGICIGGTANTFEDICRRAEEGVDYIGLGPFRFTTTKKNLSPVLGIEGYIRIMEKVKSAGITIPIVAIGGIAMADIDAILATGIYGIAVSGLLTNNHHLTKKLYVNYSR